MSLSAALGGVLALEGSFSSEDPHVGATSLAVSPFPGCCPGSTARVIFSLSSHCSFFLSLMLARSVFVLPSLAAAPAALRGCGLRVFCGLCGCVGMCLPLPLSTPPVPASSHGLPSSSRSTLTFLPLSPDLPPDTYVASSSSSGEATAPFRYIAPIRPRHSKPTR
jgi:hypothetical protein